MRFEAFRREDERSISGELKGCVFPSSNSDNDFHFTPPQKLLKAMQGKTDCRLKSLNL